VSGGNVLTGRVLASLPKHDGAKVIFGEGCRLSAERLQAEHITFRQIPYEIKAR
jgi:adenine-specific DNA-methyltransferase